MTGDLGAGVAVALDEGPVALSAACAAGQSRGTGCLLFNGRDGEWLAEIGQAAKRGVTATCLNQTRPQAGVPDIWLAFAPVKKTPADYLVQKATELGVSVPAAGLHPPHHRHPRQSGTHGRQCGGGGGTVRAADGAGDPRADGPRQAAGLLAEGAAAYFCDEGGDAKAADGGGARKPRAALPPFSPARKAASIRPNAQLLRALPFVVPVTLGPRILRADTAALAALSIWQSAAGDWR